MKDYEFTLPVCGKVITWRPYPVGTYLDFVAAHNKEHNRHMLGPNLLVERIVTFDGKPRSQQIVDIRSWDEIDYQAFSEHVDLIDMQRRAAHAKDKPGMPIVQRLENAVVRLQAANSEFAQVVNEIRLEAHALAQAQEQAGPLAGK